MARMIFWRLLQFPLILGMIFVVTLTLAWIVPGDPLDTDDGREIAPEIRAAMLKQYNMDAGPIHFGASYLMKPKKSSAKLTSPGVKPETGPDPDQKPRLNGRIRGRIDGSQESS